MSEITTIGLDLAKHVFQVHGIDAQGTTVLRKRLRRGQVLAFFSRIPRCVVGLEACATGHYWARELRALGHEVRLMPAQYVKAYIKRNKHDAADAEAICRRLGARRCALCRSRRLTSKQPCCCTVAGSGWCASVRVW
jgi:transposase